MGKCSSCNEWNTIQEELSQPAASSDKHSASLSGGKVQVLSSIETAQYPRLNTQVGEFNRVLGGGIAAGSIVLVGGQPGIGKSTLLLQVALRLGKPVLYVSGEESAQQIKLRAQRIDDIESDCLILTETNTDTIISHAKKIKPALIIVDSIQTLFTQRLESSPGTVSQIRECAHQLMQFAKSTQIPVFLIGHITKDGSIAGPKVLEHIVDVVLQFEGDRNYMYRLLRSYKNRYGSTDEIGIFEMGSHGLRPVDNPSELLITNRDDMFSGSAVAVMMEGIRPVLLEVQSLVSPAVYGTPQRSATGFDLRRLSMLLAVLEKRAGFRFAQQDVFLNMAGGLKVQDPAIDMAVISALMSSYTDEPIPSEYCFTGEIGLSGEIRPVSKLEQRILEADRLGFKKIFVPEQSLKRMKSLSGQIEVIGVSRIESIIHRLFNTSANSNH
jgi:DNA repair protein RadA/Sms